MACVLGNAIPVYNTFCPDPEVLGLSVIYSYYSLAIVLVSIVSATLGLAVKTFTVVLPTSLFLVFRATGITLANSAFHV